MTLAAPVNRDAEFAKRWAARLFYIRRAKLARMAHWRPCPEPQSLVSPCLVRGGPCQHEFRKTANAKRGPHVALYGMMILNGLPVCLGVKETQRLTGRPIGDRSPKPVFF